MKNSILKNKMNKSYFLIEKIGLAHMVKRNEKHKKPKCYRNQDKCQQSELFSKK